MSIYRDNKNKGVNNMFTNAETRRQFRQRENTKAKILKAYGENFITAKQSELCTNCQLGITGGGAVLKAFTPLTRTGGIAVISPKSNRQ